METRKIGSLDVTLCGLGTNNFGMRIDQDQTTAVVDAALDAGVNFFDTADLYGGTKSEQFLGKALGARRDDVVVATKFGGPLDDNPEHRGGSARWVRRACEDSLRRLGTDRIDLYQLHFPDMTVPIEETLTALDKLVKAGKVREIGNSNFTGEMIEEADDISEKLGIARFVGAHNKLPGGAPQGLHERPCDGDRRAVGRVRGCARPHAARPRDVVAAEQTH